MTRPPTHSPSLESSGLVYTTEYGPDSADHYQEWLVARSLADGSVQSKLSLGTNTGDSQVWAITQGMAIVRLESLVNAGTATTFSLEAIRLSDGSEVWSRGWTEYTQIVLDGDKLVTSMNGGWIGVLDVGTGAVSWSISNYRVSMGLAVSHGVIVTATRVSDPTYTWISQLVGLSEVDGHQVWANDPVHVFGDYGGPYSNGTTFFVASPLSGAIEGHDFATGALEWQTSAYPNTGPGTEYSTGGAASDGDTIFAPAINYVSGADGNAQNTSVVRAFTDGTRSGTPSSRATWPPTTCRWWRTAWSTSRPSMRRPRPTPSSLCPLPAGRYCGPVRPNPKASPPHTWQAATSSWVRRCSVPKKPPRNNPSIHTACALARQLGAYGLFGCKH